MMRKIFLTTIALLMSVSASYAVDLKLSGSMLIEGEYCSNYNLSADDAYAFMDIGQELKLNANLIINDETSITTRFDILRDDEDPYVWGGDPMSYSDPYEDGIFAVKRVYMTHKFPTKTTMHLGLMDGQEWASSFGNDKGGRYRIFLQQETPFGYGFFVYEKYLDQGYNEYGTPSGNEDAENDDYQIYYLAGITKLADIVYIKPLFAYGQVGDANQLPGMPITFGAGGIPGGVDGEVDGSLFVFDLGWDGTLEDLGIGFEGEFVYQNISPDIDGLDIDDISLIGFYINAWYKIEPATVGMWLAYGSYDDDTTVGYDFDDDFNSSTILGDDIGFNGGDDIKAATAFQLYADIVVPSLEKLTVSPSVTYVMSNIDSGDRLMAGRSEDTGFELDIDCSYAITDALTYNAGLAYASISYDVDGVDTDDPDGIVKLYHNFAIKF